MRKRLKVTILTLVLLFTFSLPVLAHIATDRVWANNVVCYDSGYSGTSATNRIKESANNWNSKVSSFEFEYLDGSSHQLKSGSTSPGAPAETYVEIGGDWSTNITGCTTHFSTAYSWYYGTGSPSSSQYDMLSICKHELGHWYLLDDCYNSNHSSSVMYGYVSAGQKKRTIQSHDYSPAQSMY